MRTESLATQLLALAAVAVLLAVATVAHARDTRHRLPLASALARAQASGKPAEGVRLYFGKQKHPKALSQLGVARTNKKTNFFNKCDEEGCEWAFLSSMIALTRYGGMES